MIFLTVGTQFPFDRLVKAIDDLIEQKGLTEEFFCQIGSSSYVPRNFKAVSSLEKHLFDKYMRQASSIISHAGMGTITAALQFDKPLLVMPRLAQYKEVVNDHQVAIARKFEADGHLLAAYDTSELPDKFEQLRSFIPQPRDCQPQQVAQRIADYLDNLTRT